MGRFIVASLTIILLVSSVDVRADDTPMRTIDVNGKGTVTAIPDIADVTTGVTNRADSARQALDANNAAMARLLKALKKAGINEADIRTSGFTVSPYYEIIKSLSSSGKRRVAGYRATNQVTVTVRDLKKVGRVIDDVVTAGSNQVRGIQFRVSEPVRLLDGARKKAFADAKRRAELYADAADADLGKVIHIQESSARFPQPRLLATSAMRESRDVPVSPGSQKLSVNVSVKFELD